MTAFANSDVMLAQNKKSKESFTRCSRNSSTVVRNFPFYPMNVWCKTIDLKEGKSPASNG